MRYAFTMLEIVFVIMLVGIISFLAVPDFNDNTLRRAADQVISHIRYTQHLAMMDNKFVPNQDMSQYTNATQKRKEAQYWYKGRWQILFFNVNGETPANSFTAYTIFSDSPNTGNNSNYDGNPNQSAGFQEVSTNPENPDKYLIGANHSSFTIGDEHITESLNLNTTYGVELVLFENSCGNMNSHRLAFDNTGRPIRGNLSSSTSAYDNGNLMTDQCQIVLCNNSPCDDDNVTIAIEPETGYAHILRN